MFVLNAESGGGMQLLLGRSAKASSGSNSLPPAVLNNDTQAAERMELYEPGKAYSSATSWVLIVDLLCERVPIEQASGVIVCNSHKVSDGSNIALSSHPPLSATAPPLCALSDDAYGFTRGFAKVAR